MRTPRTAFPTLLLVLLLGIGFAAAEPPANTVGIGLRGAARDPTSLVLVAKVKLLDLKLSRSFESSLSLRPKLLVGSYLEARLPLSFELALTSRVYPFVSVGAAFNTDDLGHVDDMFGFGADVALSQRLTLGLTCNTIRQRRIPDHDTELILSINFEL